jgi:general secretion pathway protein G
MTKRKRAARAADNEQGLTLVEMMVVIAIMGLIMGAVGVQLYKKWRQAQIETTKQEIMTTKTALTEYALDQPDRCPSSLSDLAENGNLEDEPLDAWGEPLLFRCPAQNGRAVADIWSKGPDGEEGTGDDICSWKIKRRRRGERGSRRAGRAGRAEVRP